MPVAELCLRPLWEIAELIATRSITATEVTNTVLDAVEEHDARLHCYITVLADDARRRARALDDALAQGHRPGPLYGVPISLKDNIETAGIRTTAGSRVLADYVPTATATIARRLHDAGAILIGKANLYEFAYGARHPEFPAPVNAWKPGYVTGGSSSGSGAAVAAGLCHGSIGSDTGGSIRVPAALCGIVGVKPTYGRVSRAGVIPLSYNMDAAGPMTRTVRDAALMLQAIAGHDPDDPFTSTHPVPDYVSHLEGGVRGLRIGIFDDRALDMISGECRAAMAEVRRVLEACGARVVPIPVPDLEVAQILSEIIIGCEASEYHRPHLRARAHDYGPSVRLRLERNEFIPATDYVHAQRVRQKMVGELRASMRDLEALVTPAHPCGAFPNDAPHLVIEGRTVEIAAATSRYTRLFNLTGNPAVVLPCGMTADGLPLSLQVVGHAFDEVTMFRVARAYERETVWHTRHPVLS